MGSVSFSGTNLVTGSVDLFDTKFVSKEDWVLAWAAENPRSLWKLTVNYYSHKSQFGSGQSDVCHNTTFFQIHQCRTVVAYIV